MADAGGGGMRWIKYGCLGCAGLVLIAVLGVGGLVGVAWMGAQDPDVEDRVLTPDVPMAGPPDGQASTPVGVGQGKVTLDLSGAGFQVLPGRPGESLRVEANFDRNAFVMEEAFEKPEGEPWAYTFRFRRKGSGPLAALRQMFSGSDPDIRIYLPPDVPIELDLSAGRGAVEIQLGGLWLTEADIGVTMGAVALDIDEPLREPMARLGIDVSMAGGQLAHLGNASPRKLVVDFSMGGMQLDLRGEWRNDSQITVTTKSAGGQLQLPHNVLLEGIDSGRLPGNVQPEIKLPTLRFTPDSNLEELDVSH